MRKLSEMHHQYNVTDPDSALHAAVDPICRQGRSQRRIWCPGGQGETSERRILQVSPMVLFLFYCECLRTLKTSSLPRQVFYICTWIRTCIDDEIWSLEPAEMLVPYLPVPVPRYGTYLPTGTFCFEAFVKQLGTVVAY